MEIVFRSVVESCSPRAQRRAVISVE